MEKRTGDGKRIAKRMVTEPGGKTVDAREMVTGRARGIVLRRKEPRKEW
jgi:hypothetical protein